jgi:hypothetical protein
MPATLSPRREAARSFLVALEAALAADEVLADRRCVQLLIEKAEAEHAAGSRKRFDAAAIFRTRVLYDRVDAFIATWCRKRDFRADPYKVFRYGGAERGPTQHETGLGPSLPFIDRALARLAEAVPEIADGRRGVAKRPDQTISPGLRFQPPLPFGAAGEVIYRGDRTDLVRGIFLVATYVATGGDPSRGWRYDAGVLIVYGADTPRCVLGPELWEAWPDLRERVWTAARVWPILL